MTAHSLHRPRLTLALDAEDLGALHVLVGQAAALKPFFRPALMIRLQLAAVLVGYLLAGTAIAGALPLLPRPSLHGAVFHAPVHGRE